MESDHNDTTAPCRRCKQRPATTTFTRDANKWSVQVCGLCFDRISVQDAFEDKLVYMDNLSSNGQYDDALACLDGIWEANRHRDHTGWLARSIAAHRAFILWEAERYAESLEECEKVEQLGFEDAWYRWSAATAKAHALEGLGRHAEALAAFEEAFRYQDPRYMETARHLMKWLVELSEKAGKPVDESWREVVKNIAHDYEVELPVRPTLGESILALYELTEGKPSRRKREQKAKNP